MDQAVFFIGALVFGLFIGVLSGMLGIGGGTVMVPAFRLIFGMEPLAATATSLFTIIPTSIAGAITHLRQKTALLPLGLAMGIGGAITSPVGVWLSTISPAWLVMTVAAVVIGYSAINMLFKAAKARRAQKSREADAASSAKGQTESGSASTDVVEVPLADAKGRAQAIRSLEEKEATYQVAKKDLARGALIGICAGVLSGYVGVGGGFIMVPLMLGWLGVSMRVASGTSLVAMVILAIPGAVEQGILGNIDYMVGIATALGSIPGAWIGAKVARKVPENMLRFMFGGFLVVAALLLVSKEFF